MLTAYLSATSRLLQNPAAPNPLYSTADLTDYINSARGQLAGEANCTRVIGTLSTTAGTTTYPFSAINSGGPANGVQGVLHVRTIWYLLGAGQVWVRPRSFEWFGLYELNNAAPQSGQPKVWAQFGQGVYGNIYISPIPDFSYSLNMDTVCYPVPLVDDTTPEAIPYLWSDAVPYYAAYLALLGSQTGGRTAEADKMMERYKEFVSRARRAATPEVLPGLYPQNIDPGRPPPPAPAGGA
jgi:hypothetical protein